MASVLIVESDPAFRLYVQVVFRDAGHRVTCVGDADQALTMLATNRFDLAIVGELTTTGAVGIAKARADLSIATRTRVVLHTSESSITAEVDAHELDVDVLPMPARPAELLALTSLGSGLELV